MSLETSILTSIKKLLGLSETVTNFDGDILIHINTVIANLNQMGIGPVDGMIIEDSSVTWDQFFTNDSHDIPVIEEAEDGSYEETSETIIKDKKLQQQVKSYIFLKVKLLFDPPSNGNLLKAMKENAEELEVRLYTLKGGY
jgi:hypothetical protein